MKWKAKSEPEIGAWRFVRKFALLPTEVGGYYVCLEYYISHQKYTSVLDQDGQRISKRWEEVRRMFNDFGV